MTVPEKDPDFFQKERTELARERTLFARERNQLAAERTFTAWLRTGLAGVGGGLALIRFIQFHGEEKIALAKLIGGILLIWGFLVIVYALRSYLKNARKLDTGDDVSRVGVISIALVLLFLSILVFILAMD